MALIIAKPPVTMQKRARARAASRPPPKTARLVTMHRSRRPAALSSSMAALSAARLQVLQAALTLTSDNRLLTNPGTTCMYRVKCAGSRKRLWASST